MGIDSLMTKGFWNHLHVNEIYKTKPWWTKHVDVHSWLTHRTERTRHTCCDHCDFSLLIFYMHKWLYKYLITKEDITCLPFSLFFTKILFNFFIVDNTVNKIIIIIISIIIITVYIYEHSYNPKTLRNGQIS